jgi:hypothetical protein
MKRSGDKRQTVLGAKDNVRQDVRVGCDMFFRPSGAWGEFYSNSSPTACAMGYDLSPASRAARWGSVSQFRTIRGRQAVPLRGWQRSHVLRLYLTNTSLLW